MKSPPPVSATDAFTAAPQPDKTSGRAGLSIFVISLRHELDEHVNNCIVIILIVDMNIHHS